ncbi:unnamed protein product [Didymodactylos carnosus]|uniref:Methyltransferase n=1 Tax=Didymodactylos carnosus TaxID=1234261 RepID=A0A814DFX9_9BILA|nr:unnamed protein product [Didymodactylos carnosus]CAF1016523.1 unnamed protein product [Didymodactylos carnosus]CAF3729394.1 unnamed protein product [Didymodactylos carnosus]CAF3785579.1 unnamed protein product [Didymodactylos carnosus]
MEKSITKRSNEEVLKQVNEYKSFYDTDGKETTTKRKDNYTDLVVDYYSLATDFYEYGWGRSFHFANRFKGETLQESIQRHESYLALRLNLKAGQKVLDIGCGIGGPLRRIANLSGGHITGLTISNYQIQRAKAIGIPANCSFVQGDFMKIPFEDSTFDHTYVIEAVCHAPDKAKCFSEVFRILKPGGYFIGYDWCLTDSFDQQNPQHIETKKLIEEGNALPELRTMKELVSDLRSVGFMIEEADILKSEVLWYLPLKGESILSINGFRSSNIGRWLTKNSVWLMEKSGFAAKGSLDTLGVLEKAAQGLIRGGESEIFTPYFFFLAQRPHQKA